MPKSSRKPLRKQEIPSLSVLSTECTPASIGDSVTADIRFQSATTTAPTIISKTGRLTFPISRYQHYGFPRTAQIASSRNSPISLVPSYHRDSLALWISHNLSTSPLHNPLEPMDAYKLFHLSENIDDINRILELLEPNGLLLRTWSYFRHCQWTARKLEEEAWYQRDSAKDLLVELQKLGIDEVLHPLVAEARQLDRRATRFARPASPITIRLPARAPAPLTDMTTIYSMELDTGGPLWPIVIVDDDMTTPPTTSSSSSGPPFKKRRGTPWQTSTYVLHQWQHTLNLGSSGLERG